MFNKLSSSLQINSRTTSKSSLPSTKMIPLLPRKSSALIPNSFITSWGFISLTIDFSFSLMTSFTFFFGRLLIVIGECEVKIT